MNGSVSRILVVCILALATALPALADGDKKRHRSSQYTFTAFLSGAQEVPNAAASEAAGRVAVRFSRDLSKVHVRLKLQGINSMVVAGHFHCGLAGTNGPVAFGLLQPGPLSEIGEFTRVTLTNEDALGTDCAPNVGRPINNIASLFFAMREGLVYLNLHTPDFPAGELRGQMIPAR